MSEVTAYPANKLSLKKIATLVLKLAVSVALIYYILSKTNLLQIWISIKSANPYLLFLSFLLHAIGYYASAYRWQVLLAAHNMHIPVSYLVESYAVGMYFNNILPSTIGGDVVRAYDTWRYGYPKGKAIAVVLVERFLGLFALIIFAVVVVLLASDITQKIPNIRLWIALLFIIMLSITFAIFSNQNLAKKAGLIFNLPGLRIIKNKVNKFADAFKEFRGKNKVLAIALGLSFLLQINVIIHYYLISEALGMEISLIKYMFVIPIAIFIMMIPVSVNAIGIRENIYAFFLTTYGASVASCIAFSWIAYGMVLLLGIIGGIILVFRKQGKREIEGFITKVEEGNVRKAEIVEPDRRKILDTQKELFDERKSKLAKYQELFLGEKGFLKMLKYELIITLFSWIPGALGLILRSKFYPLILGKVGRNVVFGANVTIRHPSKIKIGDNVVIDDNCILDAKGDGNEGISIGNGVFIGKNTILTCHSGDIIIEDNVNIGFNCVISSLGSIVIKKNNLIAAFCYLVGGDHIADRTDIPILFQGRKATGIVLEENSWLGAGVTVLDGSIIGRDCIIGANAVVTGKIPEFSVAVGAPARVIRDRRQKEKD